MKVCGNIAFQDGWLHFTVGGPGFGKPGMGLQITFQTLKYEEQYAISLSACLQGTGNGCADLTFNPETGELGMGLGHTVVGFGGYDAGVSVVVSEKNLLTGESEVLPWLQLNPVELYKETSDYLWRNPGAERTANGVMTAIVRHIVSLCR